MKFSGRLAAALALALASIPAAAQVPPFPAAFKSQDIAANGTTLHVRVGGKGPAVVLLHGFGETGDMWAPLAAALMKDHIVIVPDLRGMGLSAHPGGGYDKATQGRDIAAILAHYKIDKFALVTHDIGNYGRLCARDAATRPRDAFRAARRARTGHRSRGTRF